MAPDSKTVTYDALYGALPTPDRTGYTFKGWFDQAEGGTLVTAETVVQITDGQTLYAHWQEIYHLTQITIRDAAGRPLDNLPAAPFSARVGVVNPPSATADILILASYDAAGRLIEVHYPTVAPPEGYTLMFAANFENAQGDAVCVKAFGLSSQNTFAPVVPAAQFSTGP